MKANGAPEKIWMGKYTQSLMLSNPNSNTYVEYVHKDTFIEKAVYFMKKIEDVNEYTWYNEEEHAVGIAEKCIEDFIKYMKGE